MHQSHGLRSAAPHDRRPSRVLEFGDMHQRKTKQHDNNDSVAAQDPSTMSCATTRTDCLIYGAVCIEAAEKDGLPKKRLLEKGSV